MPLDVYIQPRFEAPRVGGQYEYICSLDDDGYYWFLHPHFEELAKDTGQYIDLYGGAGFSGEALGALRRTIAVARQQTDAQPERWDVVVGVRPGVVAQEIRSGVEKAEMQLLLEKLDAGACKAQSIGEFLTCFGD
jgi:hypothetical protein